jgi:hypothetical protein
MIVSHLRAYQSPIGWLFYVVPLLIISTWSLHKNVSFSMGTPCYIKLHISMYQLIDDEAHIIFKAMTYVRVLISCRLSDTNNTTWTILKYEEAVHKYKYMYFLFIIPIEKSLKIPIGQIEFVNRRPNDTMTTTKDQTIQWLQQKDKRYLWLQQKAKRYNDYNKRPNDTMTTTKGQTIQWLQQKDKRYNDYNKRTNDTMTTTKGQTIQWLQQKDKDRNNALQNTTQNANDRAKRTSLTNRGAPDG